MTHTRNWWNPVAEQFYFKGLKDLSQHIDVVSNHMIEREKFLVGIILSKQTMSLMKRIRLKNVFFEPKWWKNSNWIQNLWNIYNWMKLIVYLWIEISIINIKHLVDFAFILPWYNLIFSFISLNGPRNVTNSKKCKKIFPAKFWVMPQIFITSLY